MQILGSLSFGLLILTVLLKANPQQPLEPQVESSFPEPAVSEFALEYVWPADGVISSHYGQRWGRLHMGIDIAAPRNTPVRAVAAGLVSFAGRSNGYGKNIVLVHQDGSSSLYAHLEKYVLPVGAKVSAGDIIGYMGSSGSATGNHLHFEWRDSNNRALDPLIVLKKASEPYYVFNKRQLFQRLLVQQH